jgi:sucrose phosphorylase
MRRLIRRRIEQPAFHPNAGQEVLEFGPEVFALLRDRPGVQRLLALTNVTATQVRVQIPVERLGGARLWRDVLSRARYQADEGVLSIALRPYGVAWLTMV